MSKNGEPSFWSRLRSRISGFDTFVTRVRSQVALLLVVIVVGLVATMVWTAFVPWPTPFPFVVTQITFFDEVEALLATGTAALAYAALVQAVSVEKARYWSMRAFPLILIHRAAQEETELLPGAFVVTSGDPKDLPKFTVKNVGAGYAIGLTVRLFVWTVRWPPSAKTPPLEPGDEPWAGVSPTYEKTLIDWFILTPGGKAPVSVDEALGNLKAALASVPWSVPRTINTIEFVYQFLVLAECDSVTREIGRPVQAVGMFFSRRDGQPPDAPQAQWRIMTRAQLRKIKTVPRLDEM